MVESVYAGASLESTSTEGSRVGHHLCRLRRLAAAKPGAWVEASTGHGLTLAWRSGAAGEELAISRPRGVAFERDLRLVIQAVREDCGVTVTGRRVVGHAIHMTLVGPGGPDRQA